MAAIRGPSWLMEMTCQPSYPLNSENASPPGTVWAYLSWAFSWADMAVTHKTPARTVTRPIARMPTLFIAEFLRRGLGCQREACPTYVGTAPRSLGMRALRPG